MTVHAQTTLVPGQYNVSTHFDTGPQAGTTQQGVFYLKAPVNGIGAISVSYPSIGLTGQGSWWNLEGSTQYTFQEFFPQALPDGSTSVTVFHTVIGDNGNGSFTSMGMGVLRNAKGAVTNTVQTTNTLTLVTAY